MNYCLNFHDSQPLMADDEETKTEKDNSKMKMFFIATIAMIIRILLGISIGYLIFGPRSRIINEIINEDDVSEITDPIDSYALIDVSKLTEWNVMRIENSIFQCMKLKKKLIIMFKIRVFLSNYSVKVAKKHLRQKKRY